MKTKALTEPKQRKAFRDKYLAAVLAVAALLISSLASAQLDSTKYSRINGYGFMYKRWGGDSVLMVPLSTSPHVPYRMGAIRYRASDSTLQLWTGYQWNSILTGVGNGVDTAYAYDDSTLAIETPNRDYFIKIKGKPSATQLNDSAFIVGDDTITIHGTGGGGAPSGPAGGDLTGTYPNPTIASNAVTTTKINNGAVTIPKLSATGTANNQKFHRGDDTWAEPPIVDTVNANLPTGAIRSNAYYFGPPAADSTWRIISSAGDLLYQRNEAGTWVEKLAISIEDDIVVLDSVFFSGSTWDAFGDSYTYGVGASPSSNKYISLLETALSMTANNVGESGTGIMDVQFKMYRDFAAFGQSNRRSTTMLIGFNDYLKSSSGSATQAMFPWAFRAAIFNHFLDTAIASNDGGLTTTGSWSTFDLSASYPQKSKYLLSGTGRLSVASSVGDSKTYTFDGDNVGFFFLGANGTTQDYGRLKVEIDGLAVDTVDENGIADNQTVFSNSASRTEDLVGAAAVYTGLTNGSHTIKLTLLDNKNTNIDAFGVMDIPTASQSMVVGSIQKLLSAGYTAMSAGSPKNDAGVDATNAIIQSVVNEFRLLGYPVVFNDVNVYTNPSTDIDTDNIHWDNSGHLAGKNSFRAKIRL